MLFRSNMDKTGIVKKFNFWFTKLKTQNSELTLISNKCQDPGGLCIVLNPFS